MTGKEITNKIMSDEDLSANFEPAWQTLRKLLSDDAEYNGKELSYLCDPASLVLTSAGLFLTLCERFGVNPVIVLGSGMCRRNAA